jgi:hypothetical protein
MVETRVEYGFDCARRHWGILLCLLGYFGLHCEC